MREILIRWEFKLKSINQLLKPTSLVTICLSLRRKDSQELIESGDLNIHICMYLSLVHKRSVFRKAEVAYVLLIVFMLIAWSSILIGTKTKNRMKKIKLFF